MGRHTASAATSQQDVFGALSSCTEKISAHELAKKMDIPYPPVTNCLRMLAKKGLVAVDKDGQYKHYSVIPGVDVSQIRRASVGTTGTYKRTSATPQGRFKVAVERLVHLMAQIDPAVDAVMEAYSEVDPLIMTPEDREALSHLDAVADMLKRKKR